MKESEQMLKEQLDLDTKKGKFFKEIKTAVDQSVTNTKERRQRMKKNAEQYASPGWDEENLDSWDTRAYVNFLFSTVEATAPLLTDNKPKMTILSRFPFQQKMATRYTRAFEFLWDEIEMQDKGLKAARDALVFGQAVYKIYFDPDAEDGIGELAVEVIDPRCFVVPAGYEDVWDAPWCGDVKYQPMSWIKRHYPNKYKACVGHDVEEDDVLMTHPVSENEDYVKVYQIWMEDLSTEKIMKSDEEGQQIEEEAAKYPHGRLLVFTDKYIILDDRPSPYMHDKPPYVVQYNYQELHSIWGTSENDQIEGLIKEFNLRLANLVHQAARQDKPSILYDKKVISDEGLIRKAIAEGNVAIAVNGDYIDDVGKAANILNMDKMHPSQLQLLNIIPGLIAEVSGVRDIAKGVSDKKERQTTQEISVLIESAYTRVRQKVRNVEFALKRIAVLMLNLMQQYYTETRAFPIKQGEEVRYGKISNNPDFVKDMYTPSPEAQDTAEENRTQEMRQEMDDYEKMISFLTGDDGDQIKSVYVNFIIQIDTNSTLPLDKQSKVNMFLKLAEQKHVDTEGVLRALGIPEAEEILQRLKDQKEEKKKLMAQQGGGKGGQQKQQPNPVNDIQDKQRKQMAGVPA